MNANGSPPLEGPPERPAFQEDHTPFAGLVRTPVPRRDRALAWVLTAAAHVGVLALLLWHAGPSPSRTAPSLPPLQVSLLETPKPEPPGPPGGTEADLVRPAPPPRPRLSRDVEEVSPPVPDNSDILSDSQLAGSTSVGEGGGGGGGGGCDIARAIQQALRRDPRVRVAVQDANRIGKAVMLWNGDWVRTGGQDGKGLSAVREAIMW